MFLSSYSSRIIPIQDNCVDLCNLFTADRRGGGFDLCDGPEASTCNSASICTNLYWWSTEDGSRGLVYETDLDLAIELEPLTCPDAGEIVRAPPELSLLVQVTLQIISHLPVIDQIEGDLIHQYHDDILALENASIRFPDSSAIVNEISSTCGYYPTRSVNQIIRFLTRNARPEIFADHEPFSNCLLCGDRWCYRQYGPGVAIPLQELVDLTHQESFDHRGSCRIDYSSYYGNGGYRGPYFTGYVEQVVAISFENPRSVSYPMELRFENDVHTYDLVALAHMDPFTNQPFADILRDGRWYRTSGDTMTVRDLQNNSTVATVSSAFYIRRTD